MGMTFYQLKEEEYIKYAIEQIMKNRMIELNEIYQANIDALRENELLTYLINKYNNLL